MTGQTPANPLSSPLHRLGLPVQGSGGSVFARSSRRSRITLDTRPLVIVQPEPNDTRLVSSRVTSRT
ncbi:MAG: hypothetical protein DSM106950_45940, partial [Stigonema ocellatum SAG 48.90 = DSM 106950]|nr:hypothetical protein [Stigonema ocellatum SAG 48.90 = DSM 106950]